MWEALAQCDALLAPIVAKTAIPGNTERIDLRLCTGQMLSSATTIASIVTVFVVIALIVYWCYGPHSK
jgi:hypothetical protein